MTSIKFFAALLLSALTPLANAGFNEVEYQVTFPGEYAFGIAVLDSRDFVSENPSNASLLGGEISGVFGSRRPLTTYAKIPVADEIAEGLRLHFSDKLKRPIVTVPTSPGQTMGKLVEKIKAIGVKRTVILDIQSIWVEMANKTNTQVAYHLDALVLDEHGNVLAKNTASEMAHSREWGTYASDEIVGRAISSLLSSSEILRVMTKP